MLCILVAGMPASGKSTLAAKLSESLGFPMFSKDSMKEKLYDTVGFRSRAEKVALGVGAMEILYYAAGQVMARGGSVILENNFEHASREGIQRLLAQYRCPAVTVLLTGNPEAIYRRFLARESSPDRHRGHVVNTCYPEPDPVPEGKKKEAPPLTLEQYIAGFIGRGMDSFCVGKLLKVDATDLSQVDAESIAEQIKVLAG